ncbi:MAG: metallophosphoesterase [Nitrospirae bacterium]|nr:metallophosphoesterase [Nitrospirota bacterium]
MKGDLNKCHPDVIVVTGDIFEKEHIDEECHKDILQRLKKLSDAAKRKDSDPVVPVFVVPGNHDLRWQGLFCEEPKIEKLLNDLFSKLFPKVFPLFSKIVPEVIPNLTIKLFVYFITKLLPKQLPRQLRKKKIELLIKPIIEYIKHSEKSHERFAERNAKEEAIKTFEKVFEQEIDGFKVNIETAILKTHDMLIACFNSNREHKDYDFAKGFVSREDFNKFNDYISTEIPDKEERLKYKKIALLHHHPMPLYISETEVNITESYESSFLILSDSATFMRRMLGNNVILILHGHKHFSGFSKASFPVEPSFKIRRTIGVISVASVNPTEKSLSYNLIRYYDSGRVTLDIRESIGSNSFVSKHGSVDIFTYEEARQNAFIESLDVFDTITEKATHFFTITPEGDYRARNEYKGLKTLKDRCTKIQGESINMKNKRLYGTHTIPKKDKGKVKWEPIGDPIEYRDIYKKQKWNIIFTPPLTKDASIEYTYIQTEPNAFSLNKEEKKWDLIVRGINREDIQNEDLKESVLIKTDNQAYRNLLLHVKFPEGFRPLHPKVVVEREINEKTYMLNDEEERYCKGRFYYSEESNTATLFVDNTLYQVAIKRYKNLLIQYCLAIKF